MSLIHLAIPVFFVLIGVELLAARLLERDVYRLADSVSDLSCGILQQVVEVFLKTALFAGYAWLFARHRLFDVPPGAAWAWAACFVGVDFLYYWFHRWSHEVNAGWAAHVVHHQSEEYNLTVALRQGALQPAFSWVFYLPLAVLGFPPAMFLAVSSFNTLYQFWIHTRLIGRLGPLEWVLNTPVPPPRPPRAQPELHRPQPRRHAHRVGPAVRHVRRRSGTSPSTASRGRSRAGTRSGPTSTTGRRCGTWRGGRGGRSTGCGSSGSGRAGGPPTSAATRARPRWTEATPREVRRAAAAGLKLYVLAPVRAREPRRTVAFLVPSPHRSGLGPGGRAQARIVLEPGSASAASWTAGLGAARARWPRRARLPRAPAPRAGHRRPGRTRPAGRAGKGLPLPAGLALASALTQRRS